MSRARGHLEAIRYADVPALMAKLAAASPTTGRDALRFTIYNAVRSNETRFAVWTEFDPGQRYLDHSGRADEGGRNPCRAPIAARRGAAAQAVEGAHERYRPCLLRRRRKAYQRHDQTKLLRDDGIKGVTVHGFRSAFTDWSSERARFPKEVADKALAHKLPNKMEAAYRRTDFFEKRRSLMARRAEYLDRVPARVSKDAGPTASEPMPLRAAA
uniref:tyrosine-type recombinase/integrase n=1 Tax=Sphingomonas bacterium TaxID=1895847 RepID=UPI002604FAD7|nr:hypothetical protein [Sphingomonas bacterium]